MSLVFTPFYLPIVGLIALFTFSYLSIMPWQYKLSVVFMVYLFTILFPTLLIHVYRRYQGWTPLEMGKKERLLRIPQFMANILVAALMIQIVCAVINVWWKISTHTAAIGGFAGALVAFSILFAFNPIWWFCLVILIAGLVGSSRMILRQHTLTQVVVGFLVGVVLGFWMIL